MAHTYQLTVVKLIDNPNREAQMKEFRQMHNYGQPFQSEPPSMLVSERELTVTLTDEEYQAVKRSVLETFK